MKFIVTHLIMIFCIISTYEILYACACDVRIRVAISIYMWKLRLARKFWNFGMGYLLNRQYVGFVRPSEEDYGLFTTLHLRWKRLTEIASRMTETPNIFEQLIAFLWTFNKMEVRSCLHIAMPSLGHHQNA